MYAQCNEFAWSERQGKKPKFQYRLPLLGNVCRRFWVLAAGYLQYPNSRVAQAEACIRQGKHWPEKVVLDKRSQALNLSTYCIAFLKEYIFKNSQCSPSRNVFYVDFCGLKTLYTMYCKDSKGMRRVKFSTMCKLWTDVLCDGVTDPETSVHSRVVIRKTRAKGFQQCNKCCYFKCRLSGTTDVNKRATYQRRLQAHIAEIMDDREELARVQRLCMRSSKLCGFYIDAADSCKFRLPTTKNPAKQLAKLWRIKQKLTCVQMWDEAKSLHIFRTLPDVPTGGNLTATILMKMMTTDGWW